MSLYRRSRPPLSPLAAKPRVTESPALSSQERSCGASPLPAPRRTAERRARERGWGAAVYSGPQQRNKDSGAGGQLLPNEWMLGPSSPRLHVEEPHCFLILLGAFLKLIKGRDGYFVLSRLRLILGCRWLYLEIIYINIFRIPRGKQIIIT